MERQAASADTTGDASVPPAAAAAAEGTSAAGINKGEGNGAGLGHSGVPDAYKAVLSELAHNEAQYCAQLARVVKDYRKPLLAASIIDQSTALVVFSNIDTIVRTRDTLHCRR